MSTSEVKDSDVNLPDYDMETVLDELMDGEEVQEMANSTE